MKKINLSIFSCIFFSVVSCSTLVSCSTKEALHNTGTYVLNKECKTSDHCSGSIDSTYHQNEEAQQERQKILAQEEKNERLEKVQKDLDTKNKASNSK